MTLSPRAGAFPAAIIASLAFALPVPAQFVTYPVIATVVEQGKPPANVQIGTLKIRQPSPGQAAVFADFELDSTRGPWLDGWYDFRWVHLERFYTVNGQSRTQSRLHGPLPAIAPQTNLRPGGDDDDPYFHHYKEWFLGMVGLVKIREEGIRSSASPSVSGEPRPQCPPPPGSPCETRIDFETYLVATGVSTRSIAANEMCVLIGFDWTYTTTISSQGEQLHDVTLGPVALTPADGVTQINRALANATPAFPAPSRATNDWIAISGCQVLQCPKKVGLGTQPSNGIPEGYYAMASGKGVQSTDLGGVYFMDPTGARPPIVVQGLPAQVTGQGGPAGVGANTLVMTGPASDTMYIGTVAVPAAGAPFNRAELHRVEIDSQGTVTQATVVDAIDPGGSSDPYGYVDVEAVHDCDNDCDDDDDCVCGCHLPGYDNSSPLRYYDADTGQASEIPIYGALPQGTLQEIAVDPTGSTVYMAYAHVDPYGIALGTGEIVSVPIGGGAPQNVVQLSIIPDILETDPRTGMLHVTGFDLAGFQQRYLQVDPVAQTGTTVSTLAGFDVAMAFEVATGEMILAGDLGLTRLSQSGAESQGRRFAPSSVGIPNDIAVVPSPVVFGSGTPAPFGVYWDLPTIRPVGGGVADLPLEGNRSFAISASTNGWPITGALGLAANRTPGPGLSLLGAQFHIDLATTFLFLPVAGAPTVVIPLPLPEGTGGASLFGQLIYLSRLNLGSSEGIKITIIEN